MRCLGSMLSITSNKVVIVGSGPSLNREDVEYCKGKAYVIAINDNFRIAPFADMLFAADFLWWARNPDWREFTGRKVTVSEKARDLYGLEWIASRKERGLSENPDYVHEGNTSVIMAINLAHLSGVENIYLLGVDMQKIGSRSYWFQKEKTPPFDMMIPHFEEVAEQRPDIVNCSMVSALTCFEKKPIQECL